MVILILSSWYHHTIWKSRLDWLIFQNSGFLTIYSCAECLFLFGILLRYWYLHYIIVFVLMHLKVKIFLILFHWSNKMFLIFVSLLNEIWRNKFELLIFIFKIVRLSSWTNSLMNRSYRNEVKQAWYFFSDCAEDGQCHILKYSIIYITCYEARRIL